MTTFERNHLMIAFMSLIIQLTNLAIQLNPNYTASVIKNQPLTQIPLTQDYKPEKGDPI